MEQFIVYGIHPQLKRFRLAVFVTVALYSETVINLLNVPGSYCY